MQERKTYRRHWFWLLCWVVITSLADSQIPLSVDQAFPLRVWSPDEQTIVVQWDIHPGYYLYKDRIQITPTVDGVVQLGQPDFPPGVEHTNSILGRFIAYEAPVQIRIPVVSASSHHFSLQIHYQGCAEQGYCYPPETRVMAIELGRGAGLRINPIDRIPQKTEPKSARSLLQNPYHWTVWLSFFGVGLLISLTPCVLPMIPVLFGLIVGKEHLGHIRAFFISVFYVLGMAVTYAIAGLLFGVLGGSLQVFLQKPWYIAILCAIFVAMALSLFGVYTLEPPEKLRSFISGLSNRQRRGSFVGAVVMGCLSTLILSPCATPPLVAVLAYISQTGNAYLGGLALFIVGLGSGVPLLLIGAFGRRLLPKAGPWMRVVENLLGLVLLGMGIWMLSRILPVAVILILWAMLAFGISIYLKTFTTAYTTPQKLAKILGIVVFVYGILLLVGAFQGASEPWRPLFLKPHADLIAKPVFTPVKSVADVQQHMSQATQKPVLLDFYADWCVSCKIFERRVLSKPEVQTQLRDFLVLRADVTANSPADQELMKYFGVVAPPTLLVFDRGHQELEQLRMIGETSEQEFLKNLKKAE